MRQNESMEHQYRDEVEPRFAFGLTTENVERLRTILREDCGEDLPLEEAWSRAAGLLALTQLLLEHLPDEGAENGQGAGVGTSSHLTESHRCGINT
jgi:hypothetical protein